MIDRQIVTIMAKPLETEINLMSLRRGLIGGSTLMAVMALGAATAAVGQTTPTATFKSNVDLVRLTALVRDHKGRFVQNLTSSDFEILDGGRPQRIADFRTDMAGLSIAVLLDISGSMESGLGDAREAAMHVLSWLDAE